MGVQQSPSAASLNLLDLTLKPSSAIICSCIGEFSAPGSHEICMLKGGGIIEVHSICTSAPENPEEEPVTSLKLVVRMETRSVLRSIVVVRPSGSKRDFVAIGSDSGAVSLVDLTEKKEARILQNPVFGKTGCRRGTPGQYMCGDPKGRAVMVSAVEKRQFVYVLNRDNEGTVVVASPLEAHRSRSLTFATCGVDNGYDNPMFAALELQYPELEGEEGGEKELAYYELDLGLNHVSRRWATRVVSQKAICLAGIPGGADGPSGVLVGGEDWIEYLHENMNSELGGGRITAPIPRRALHPPDKAVLITLITVFRQKKQKFFALAQSELGDVYKVTLKFTKESGVTDMIISLLDTLPTAVSLNVTSKGFLFCASEFGNHALYQFERIDLEEVSPTTRSSKIHSSLTNPMYTTATAQSLACKFTPSSVLKNLRKVVTLESLAPTTGVLVGELAGGEVSPQIYVPCGRGEHSQLRVLRHGAAVTELAVSDLPGTPGAVFTVRDNTNQSNLDKYIIIGFADATLVLSVGETVEEVGEGSGFLTNAPTLACSALGDDRGICQVHPGGVRHIVGGTAKQWHCPGLKRVETASANQSQVLIAFAGGEIIYFELDPMSGNLTEASTRDMGADVSCLDVGSVGRGRARSFFAAVGCLDQTVRIVSLSPDSLLVQRSTTALRARPHGVCLQQTLDAQGQEDLVLTVGLEDGSALRMAIDPINGTMATAPTRRFLGARPVSACRVKVDNQLCTLLLSSRPWISHPDPTSPQKHLTTPLSYAPLDHACRFSSEAVREGIVATAGTTMRILALEGFSRTDAFNAQSIPLNYTPRQMCLLQPNQMVIVEADARTYSTNDPRSKHVSVEEEKDTMDVDSDEEEQPPDKETEEEEEVTTPIRSPIPPNDNTWGSCIRLLDPTDSCQTLDLLHLAQNDAALCCCSVHFHSRGNEPLLAVGTVTNLAMHPLRCSSAHIVLYRVVNNTRLQLLHRTKVEAPVLAITHFRGRLLAGIGPVVRLYEMGKRQLLRKCEWRSMPTLVKTIQAAGDRAYIGDMMQSVHILRYDDAQNKLNSIANDRVASRSLTCIELLDWNTVAAGDKFGNVIVLRLPRGAEANGSSAALDATGTRALWNTGRDDVMPKLEMLCHYYVGEIVTGMTRASLVAGGAESLIYTTVTGRLGAFCPFTSREDVEFYTTLEGIMHKKAPRITGREPMAYRSYYAPCKAIVDGDLCESFVKLGNMQGVDPNLQKTIAEELTRTVPEVMKKLEDMRNSLL